MFKSKLGKPQLRIGLSRNDKPRANSPIKIISAAGVKARTLGLSRSYKTPKNIDNLVKSKIITYPIKDNLPKEEKSTIKNMEYTRANKSISNRNNVQSEDTVINNKSKVRKAPSRLTSPVLESIKKVYETPNTPHNPVENEDVSISYSPLDIPSSTCTAEKIQNKKVVAAKRLILGSRNVQDASVKSSDKELSATSHTNSMKIKKFSRLSLKKSRTIDVTDDDSEEEIKPHKKKAKISSCDSNTSLISNISNCSVILDRLPMDSLEADKESYFNERTTIHDEEKIVEYIDLSQNSSNINKEILINEILSLNQVLKTKNIDLHALKQSMIYKKKHNIEDLTTRTNVWKIGCKFAVSDLLIKLQEVSQSNTTMNDLLMQLNIPEHILKYDPETEELI